MELRARASLDLVGEGSSSSIDRDRSGSEGSAMMSTNSAQVKARSSSPGSRTYAAPSQAPPRRNVVRPCPLHVSEIDTLIMLGLLQKEQREDAQALQEAE